ncbi:hypothetical protein RND81_09G076600 [Saponaria officinalis]|uniref:Uncharacterized protein n=1 Tax=Saponaria officinalis TaxID=3572 RepID=A0AAW1IIW7_SAPOF
MGKEDDQCDQITSWFDEVSENASLVQQETLRKIIEVNYGVEYLKRWLGDMENKLDVDGSTLERMYTNCVPLVSHADIQPYIERILDGCTAPLLTQQPITHLSLSSGTTEGRQKYVPFTQHNAQSTLLIFKLGAAYISRVYPIKTGGMNLEFIYSSKQVKIKGGLTVGTATTHYFSSKEFKIKQETCKCFTCSPQEVISSGDYIQSTYCHLLLGLFFSDNVEFISSTFVYSIVQAFAAFEELWEDICDDIKHGQLSSRITISTVRESVHKIIFPNPDLATRIREVCGELESVGWVKLIPKLWPNAKYVYSIMTGSMQPYIRKLRYYAGSVPLISANYGSTESWIGVNIDPSCPPENVSYAIVPTLSYFEFIPLHKQSRNGDGVIALDDFAEDKPIPLSKVRVGQLYEIVLTTFTGLYRYRLGDVVEVSGFHKGTPKLTFVCRRKLILTVNIDKNTEKDLQLVVETGCQLLSQSGEAELLDFTSHVDVSTEPGHYIIYWEIKGVVSENVLVECCKKMDESFVDHGYVVSRKTNSIGPLELRIVERGTFKKILDYYIGIGAALSQFKTPRCVNNNKLIKILNASTVRRFRSIAYCS